MWEDLNADDSAYVNYKLAAAKGNIPVGDGSQTSQSVAKLRALVIPGTAAFKAPSMNAVSGDKPSVDALLRNKARGGNALPIENGPTCVTTGVRKRQRSEPGAAGVSVPDTASLLGPLRHDPAAFQSARASAGGIAADAIASQLRGKDIGELLAMASAAKAVAANKKVAITQTVKFAGKTMTVTRLVTPGTQAAKALADEATQAAARAAISAATMASEGGAASTGAAGSVSLDALVANLDRPEAISTLTKSSLDWDTYKNQHGLDDELERCVPLRQEIIRVARLCRWRCDFTRPSHALPSSIPRALPPMQRRQGRLRGQAGLPCARGRAQVRAGAGAEGQGALPQ